MCLIGHLPFLFLLFQHFLYLDSTRLQQANPGPVLTSQRAVIIAILVSWTHCCTGHYADSKSHTQTHININHTVHSHSHPHTHTVLLSLVSSQPRFPHIRSIAAVTMEELVHTQIHVPQFPCPPPPPTKPVYLCIPGPHGYCHRWC